MRLLLILVVLALPSGAAWQRHVMTPKGGWVDIPEPHPLRYFTDYPALRCEQCDYAYCMACSAAETLEVAKKIKVETEFRFVAKTAGFEIYDLYFSFERERRNATKLILVRTGADQYREIYQCTPSTLFGMGATPSVLVRIGNDKFLEAKYDASGGGTNIVGEQATDFYDYFWFDSTGATLVDFRPILLAAKSVLPAGVSFPWRQDLAAPGVNWLWHSGGPLRSRLGIGDGSATVEFRFKHARVVVSKAIYEPRAAVTK